eukprot:COSAG03_NODE_4957_length_1379_cov_2.338281_1_plen_351_part_01
MRGAVSRQGARGSPCCANVTRRGRVLYIRAERRSIVRCRRLARVVSRRSPLPCKARRRCPAFRSISCRCRRRLGVVATADQLCTRTRHGYSPVGPLLAQSVVWAPRRRLASSRLCRWRVITQLDAWNSEPTYQLWRICYNLSLSLSLSLSPSLPPSLSLSPSLTPPLSVLHINSCWGQVTGLDLRQPLSPAVADALRAALLGKPWPMPGVDPLDLLLIHSWLTSDQLIENGWPGCSAQSAGAAPPADLQRTAGGPGVRVRAAHHWARLLTKASAPSCRLPRSVSAAQGRRLGASGGGGGACKHCKNPGRVWALLVAPALANQEWIRSRSSGSTPGIGHGLPSSAARSASAT